MYIYIYYFHCMYAKRIPFCTRSRNPRNQPANPALVRKSRTSPQVRNQSGTSPEPVTTRTPIFSQSKKTVKMCPSHFEKWVGRIVRKLVRKLVSRLVHPFADYDQSGLSVFQTSVDPRYGLNELRSGRTTQELWHVGGASPPQTPPPPPIS